MKEIHQALYVQSIRLGVLGQLISIVIFLLLEHLWMIVKFGIHSFNSSVDIEIALLIFVVGNMLALFPTILGSCILAGILQRERRLGILSVKKAILLGSIIGAIAGIVVSGLAVLLTNGRGGIIEYLFRATEVVVLALLSGGWLGKQIVRTLSPDVREVR